MAVGDYQDNLSSLSQELTELKDTVRDASSAKLLTSTVDNVLELALLRAFAAFERFLELQFYLCLTSDPSAPGSGGILQVRSKAEAELLLLSSADRVLPFASWMPTSRLLEVADRFLKPGHPFGRLRYRPVETAALQETVIVRNAAAHPDSPAMSKFRELADRRKYQSTRAADYLRSARGGQQEIQLMVTRLEVVAQGISAASDKLADSILDPESFFNADQKSPAGEYECLKCMNRITLQTDGKIGRCLACGPATPCPTCGRLNPATDRWRRDIL